MGIEEKTKVRRPICSVRALVIFFAVLLLATLLFAIVYFIVSYNNLKNQFGTLTCSITTDDRGFHEDEHYMRCNIEDQIIDAPDISIASTGEDRLVNDFSISRQTKTFYLPDRIGERFPNLLAVGSDLTELKSLQRSNFMGFKRLRFLYITNSDLEEIEHGSFYPLNGLEALDLSHNKLKRIDPSWFDSKPLLESLSLDSNEFEFIPPGCFDNLPSLKSVRLNSNKITYIASPPFPLFLYNNLIEEFYLMFNPLTFISDIAFDGNFNQLTVHLLGSTCFQNHTSTLTIPPDDWKSIVREICNGTSIE